MSLIQTKLKEGDEDGGGDGDDDSLIFNSIMCSYLSYKIRFEARERQREGER
jgi:hypothetical protein